MQNNGPGIKPDKLEQVSLIEFTKEIVQLGWLKIFLFVDGW